MKTSLAADIGGCPILYPCRESASSSSAALVLIIGEDADGLSAIAAALSSNAVLAALPISDWNGELSPWRAPGLGKSPDFSGGAGATLTRIEAMLPRLEAHMLTNGFTPCKRILSGYSLAGLCALWTVTRTSAFDSAASMSGSMWYDGFCQYLLDNPARAPSVYLSLGEQEPHTRNPRLSRVGDYTHQVLRTLSTQGTLTHFDWNPGNHFTDVPLRIAKGIDWLCTNY